MTFVPGSPLVFQIDRIAQDMGLFAPYSIIRAGELVFFRARAFIRSRLDRCRSRSGARRLTARFLPSLIAAICNCSWARPIRVQAASIGPTNRGAGTAGLYDKLIGYDYMLARFFPISMSVNICGISQTGLTLESLDSISSSIATLTLDAYATAVQPENAQFGSDHKLSFFRGSSLEATMVTPSRARMRSAFTSTALDLLAMLALYGSLIYRDTQFSTTTTTSEAAQSTRTGRCDMRRDTRYARVKVRIPSATTWTFCAGVEPDVTATGLQ